MEKLAKYQQFIQNLLSRYAEIQSTYRGTEIQAVFDTVRNHYQIVHLGWQGTRWVHSCSVHVDLQLLAKTPKR